ncbi:hypothetical protein DFJ74DRAFT_755984 [Hyaloraphidium curvatum]|nr:hypothetical protein DFJ74DRAFT_755984 [Hyaloraphidium curvatum]
MAPQQPRFAIVGGGLGGLVLALAIKKHLGVTPTVYEQAPSFDAGVGGAIGMYANGLRVIRDISPELLDRIRADSRPYVHRRWMRHDGSEVAVGEERYLAEWPTRRDELELASIGIRRWRLQQALYDACLAADIPVKLGVRAELDGQDAETGVVRLKVDGKTVEADLVFGCDGVRSAIRAALFPASEPDYTGVTCLMGAAPFRREKDGICFPSSATTRNHACYYNTGDNEQVFQIYFSTPERPETWRALSKEEGKKECEALAAQLKADGWDKQFVDPLLQAESVLRVGLRSRKPIPVWHDRRVILLGDAAHPPVPYIGQGAMMAIEDAGVLVFCLRALCQPASGGAFSFAQLEDAVRLYEKLRYPRTAETLARSESLGKMQVQRASDPDRAEVEKRERALAEEVAELGTLRVMKAGPGYDYRAEVANALAEHVRGRVLAEAHL